MIDFDIILMHAPVSWPQFPVLWLGHKDYGLGCLIAMKLYWGKLGYDATIFLVDSQDYVNADELLNNCTMIHYENHAQIVDDGWRLQ